MFSNKSVSPFFRSWAVLIVEHRWIFLLRCLGVSSLMAFFALTRIVVDNSAEVLFSSQDPSIIVREELRDDFGSDRLFQVIVEGDLFSLSYLNRLKALHNELTSMDVKVDSLGERKEDREQKRLVMKAKGFQFLHGGDQRLESESDSHKVAVLGFMVYLATNMNNLQCFGVLASLAVIFFLLFSMSFLLPLFFKPFIIGGLLPDPL